jgi:hypothetical protein
MASGPVNAVITAARTGSLLFHRYVVTRQPSEGTNHRTRWASFSLPYSTNIVVVGPKVAERLGVMFLDRVIDSSVAERAHVPPEVVHSYTEEARIGLAGYWTGWQW